MKRRTVGIVAGALAAVLVFAGAVVVYLANQRGAEIAQERAHRRAAVDMVALQTVFKSMRVTVQMKDGSKRAVSGGGATIIWVSRQTGGPDAWVAVARSPDGVFFGQRFNRGSGGAVVPAGDAEALSTDLVMRGLRAQMREAGGDEAQAQLFFDAASKGTPVPVRGASTPRN